nr:hypothetical protein [uncultured Roseateles sp.]
MDYALAMATDYVQMPHAWIAVIVPGVVLLAALARHYRLWISSMTALAFLAGTFLTWVTARWTETPDHLGLHLQPATFVLMLAVWKDRFTAQFDLQAAVRLGACLAGLTWLSLLVVDVGACAAHAACTVTGTGGEGFLDTLVLIPAIAFAGAVAIWAIGRRGALVGAKPSEV